MFKTFQDLIHLLDKKGKKSLPLTFILMVIEVLLETLSISLIIPLISTIMDESIITSNTFVGNICAFFNITTHKTLIIVCVVSLIALFIFKNIFALIECRHRYNFICRARHIVQRKIFNSILNRPFEYFLNTQTGEIIREVSDDCNRTFILLGNLLDLFASLILAAGIAVVLFIIDPLMMLVIVFLMVTLSVVLGLIVKPILRKQGKVLTSHASRNYKNVLEAVQGIKIVKITHTKDYFNKEFRTNGEKVIEADRKNIVINRIPALLTETICVVTVLLYVLILCLNGKDISTIIPTTGAFVLASLKLAPSVNKILNAGTAISYSKEALNHVMKNYSKVEEDESTPVEKITLKEGIELKNITYKYPNTDRNILLEASLSIPVGKSIGIMGLSGIGKTTSADVLLGLLNPQEGYIVFDGVEKKVNIDNYPINIGYVPQTIFIRDDTIRNNIAFGILEEDIDEARIEEAVKAAKLEEFIKELPEGINTFIGENGVRVSGGQRQRIGIARALYNNPDLLIFDEATSSLDLQTEAEIIESIEKLHGVKTMLIITHRPQVIDGCDFKYRLVDGHFISEK